MKKWLAMLLVVLAGCVACGTFADTGQKIWSIDMWRLPARGA